MKDVASKFVDAILERELASYQHDPAFHNAVGDFASDIETEFEALIELKKLKMQWDNQPEVIKRVVLADLKLTIGKAIQAGNDDYVDGFTFALLLLSK